MFSNAFADVDIAMYKSDQDSPSHTLLNTIQNARKTMQPSICQDNISPVHTHRNSSQPWAQP
jgi:hypothetical protein